MIFGNHKKNVIVLVGHGSRQDAAQKNFEKLRDAFQKKYAPVVKQKIFYKMFHEIFHEIFHKVFYKVLYGYIEAAEPILKDALEEAAKQVSSSMVPRKFFKNRPRIIIIPVLLFAAGHAKNDIPQAIAKVQKKYPNISFYQGNVLGVDYDLALLASKRYRESIATRQTQPYPPQTAIIYIGRGSNDAQACFDLRRQALLFEKVLGPNYAELYTCFIAMQKPSVADVLSLLKDNKQIKHLIVLPHILFTGILYDRIEEQFAEFQKKNPSMSVFLSSPLGLDALLLKVLGKRVKKAKRFI